MRRFTLAIAVLAAAPALAQPPTDRTKPVTGINEPAAPTPQTSTQIVDLTSGSQAASIETEEQLARRWEREQANYSYRQHQDALPVLPIQVFDAGDAANADTPAPLPCEPPLPRSPTSPSGPPEPCRP